MLAQLTVEQKETVNKVLLPVESISDEEIVVHINQGNLEAYGGIMRRYNQRMFRIARSIVTNDAAAMDVVQNSHIKAFSNLKNFRGPSTFLAWLYTITRNEALMFLRKYKREESMPNDEVQIISQLDSNKNSILHSVVQTNQPEASLENKQLQQLINNHIDSLSEDFRIVFVLRAIEQLSVKETAGILEIKEETVKTRYFRAKRLIREAIQSNLDEIGMKTYEFGGQHCDMVVAKIMAFIKNQEPIK